MKISAFKKVNQNIQFGGRLPWDASAICSGQDEYGGTGARKRGDVYAAAPNIDHSNPNIRLIINH